MPFAVGGNSRIRTNTPAENAYNTLESANRSIALRQLRLSTGKRINNAGDDVAGYITSRSLIARNGALKAALNTVGDASNVSNIIMDGLDQIYSLLNKINDATAAAANGAQGEAEKIALAKAAWRMGEQVQTVIETTVFGGKQLIDGKFDAEFVIGTNATHDLLSLILNMRADNEDFNVTGPEGAITPFDLNLYKSGERKVNEVDVDGVLRKEVVDGRGVAYTIEVNSETKTVYKRDVPSYLDPNNTFEELYYLDENATDGTTILSAAQEQTIPLLMVDSAGDVENNYFAGVSGLNMNDLNKISTGSLGIFSDQALMDSDGDFVNEQGIKVSESEKVVPIQRTLSRLADAIENVNKVASYVGGVLNRLQSQEELLKNQIVNYNAAISRIEDADVALEQLELIKGQFLQQASLVSLAQANQNPQAFLQLLQS